MLKFIKMHGAGNDYIYFDCRSTVADNVIGKIQKLCDRHFGIGGDGIVFIVNSSVADVGMKMYNIDGSEGKTCGNALRCVAALICRESGKSCVEIETAAGVSLVERIGSDYRVQFGKAHVKQIDVNDVKAYFVDVGNPHCVVFEQYSEKVLQNIRRLPMFEHGVNVEFVNNISDRKVSVVVYERGSGYTLACGSGAVAVGAACASRGYQLPMTIAMPGGDLVVGKNERGYTLTGPAEFVYEGVLYENK